MHRSHDTQLNAFVTTTLNNLHPRHTALLKPVQDYRGVPHMMSAAIPRTASEHCFLLMAYQPMQPQPRKLCVLVNGTSVTTLSLRVDREFFKNSMYECMYDKAANKLYIIDTLIHCGADFRRFNSVDRQIVSILTTILLTQDPKQPLECCCPEWTYLNLVEYGRLKNTSLGQFLPKTTDASSVLVVPELGQFGEMYFL